MSATLSSGDAVTTQGEAPAGLASATKRFGGVIAIRDVTFDLVAGEVLALLGENGAGKSTCVKLLAGVHQPDAGAVLIDEHPAERWSPLEASRRGIAVMHQHPGLFGDLSVYENIFLGHMPRNWLGGVDNDRMRRRTSELLDVVGLACRPEHLLKQLRTSEQQLVEIVRALSVDARVLIMDEPTAGLSQREVERLFRVVSGLRTHGVAMMFVSHRMEEIYRVADRIAVLRDGRLIGMGPTAEIDRDEAVRMMVGRPLSTIYPQRRSSPGPVVLDVTGLSRDSAFTDISFTVRAGEVVGLGGLVGSGRTEVARVLFGVDRPTVGEIKLAGQPTVFSDPSEAMARGVAYVSEDRLGQSLVMDFSILANASLPIIDRATFAGLIRRRSELALVEPHLQRLRLKFLNFDQPVKTLSGGNQQKVVLSKWLAANPRLMILDEPTQGVDVQSKAEVHAMIAELAAQGLAIILISSELPELLGMCDRIVVLREGRQTATFARTEADAERVIRAATDADAGVAQIREGRRHEPAADQSHGVASLARRVLAQREVGLVCAMAAVVIPVTVINPRMIGGENLTAIAMDAALLMIVAIGQMLVMLTRNIDLSVASVIGLSAYGAASFMHDHPASPVIMGVGVREPGRARLRAFERLGGGAGRRPLHRRDLGISRGVSRPCQSVGRRAADQRGSGASSLARHDRHPHPWRPGRRPDRARGARCNRCDPSPPRERPGDIRDRLEPRRRSADRHTHDPPGALRIRGGGLARRIRRGALGLALCDDRRPCRHGVRADRHRVRGGWRCGDPRRRRLSARRRARGAHPARHPERPDAGAG